MGFGGFDADFALLPTTLPAPQNLGDLVRRVMAMVAPLEVRAV